MDELKVEIVNTGKEPLPSYATPEACGMDVHACLDGPETLAPMERKLIPTGLKMQMPRGYECQLRPRSGLALNHGITILNTPGTIDADSRAEIGVVLINLSNEAFTIHPGDRICQMVFKSCVKARWEVVKEIDHTKREDGAFGKSGL